MALFSKPNWIKKYNFCRYSSAVLIFCHAPMNFSNTLGIQIRNDLKSPLFCGAYKTLQKKRTASYIIMILKCQCTYELSQKVRSWMSAFALRFSLKKVEKGCIKVRFTIIVRSTSTCEQQAEQIAWLVASAHPYQDLYAYIERLSHEYHARLKR